MGEPIHNWATHFSPGTTLLGAGPATESGEAERYRWIHCSNEGEYKGHHQGPFALTRDVFEQFVRNFRESPQYKAGALELSGGAKYTGGVQPVIQFDYEHASEMPPWEGTIPEKGAPAPGWVLEVELRSGPDGKAQLWAFGDLGPVIRSQIAARAYLWVSIAFTREGRHWITGEPIGACLTSIAFTNHPFMQDLEPLAAANRATSQPPRSAVRSPSESREEAPGARDSTTAGATTMDAKLRDRICRRLNINLAADDAALADAVDETAGKAGDLSKVLEALGETTTGDALQSIPKLRGALARIEGVAKELRDLLIGEQTADAAIAQVDAAAAMRASSLDPEKQSSIKTAFLAQRANLITEEERAKLSAPGRPLGPDKQPVPLTIAEWKACLTAGRDKFLASYGVDPSKQHLTQTLVAGAGGTQVEPPKALSITDRSTGSVTATGGEDGSKKAVDLRGIPGRNTVEKLVVHYRATDKGFAALTFMEQVKQAGFEMPNLQITE